MSSKFDYFTYFVIGVLLLIIVLGIASRFFS